MSDRPAIRVRSRSAGRIRWGGLVSLAAVAVLLAVAGCTGWTDPSAPLANPTTAAPVCPPQQAEVVFDPMTRQDVLTRVEVFDIEKPSRHGPYGSIILLDDQERWLTVEGLPEDPEWTPWLLTRAKAQYPDLVLDEDHLGPQEPSEFPDGFDKVDRYVSFRGLREVGVPFHITCATDRHDGTIRTWDGMLSGLIACSAPQDRSEVVTRAAAYCDRS